MRKSRLIKVVFILLFFVVAFHATGAEMAFCADGQYGKAADHGCQMCQPGHHSIALLPAVSIFGVSSPKGYVITNLPQVRIENPSFSFFRPPISL